MNFTIGAAAAATATAGTADAAEHRKLVDAAQQFEGMLLQEFLKPMKEHGLCAENGEDDSDDDKAASGDFAGTLSSYGAESLAAAIARGGGLGIAKRVVAKVESEGTSCAAGVRGAQFSGSPK